MIETGTLCVVMPGAVCAMRTTLLERTVWSGEFRCITAQPCKTTFPHSSMIIISAVFARDLPEAKRLHRDFGKCIPHVLTAWRSCTV
jgi:hypothetical protein